VPVYYTFLLIGWLVGGLIGRLIDSLIDIYGKSYYGNGIYREQQ